MTTLNATPVECACCHRKQSAADAPFRRCAKCIEENLVPAVYCCKECQKEDWPAHRAWHKGIKTMLSTADSHSSLMTTEEEYASLLKQGLRLVATGNSAVAASTFRRCVTLRPEQPIAHAQLGYALRNDGDLRGALPCLLRACELYAADTEQWAITAAVSWFTHAGEPSCAVDIEVPAWFVNAEARAAIAERCVSAAPSHMQCWAMLAMSLAELDADYGRAAHAFTRAAELTDQGPTKEGYMACARALHQRLERMYTQEAPPIVTFSDARLDWPAGAACDAAPRTTTDSQRRGWSIDASDGALVVEPTPGLAFTHRTPLHDPAGGTTSEPHALVATLAAEADAGLTVSVALSPTAPEDSAGLLCRCDDATWASLCVEYAGAGSARLTCAVTNGSVCDVSSHPWPCDEVGGVVAIAAWLRITKRYLPPPPTEACRTSHTCHAIVFEAAVCGASEAVGSGAVLDDTAEPPWARVRVAPLHVGRSRGAWRMGMYAQHMATAVDATAAEGAAATSAAACSARFHRMHLGAATSIEPK